MANKSTPAPHNTNSVSTGDAKGIPGLKSVTLDNNYVPARLPAGKVVGVWGMAVVRDHNGDLHQLQVGEYIKKGDVILTSQDGIVQIESDGTRLARGPEVDALDDVLTALNEQPLDDISPAAGLTGGASGGLLEGLRVSRISEVVSPQEYAYDSAGTTNAFAVRDTATSLASSTLPANALLLPSLATSVQQIPESAGATAGSFTVSAPNGLTSVTITAQTPAGSQTQTLTESQLANLATTPVTITTTAGIVALTGYNASSGVVSYTYDPSVATSSSAINDDLALSVTDALGQTTVATQRFTITDTAPVAVADVNAIVEDAAPASVAGNVISTGAGADTLGADAAAVSGVVAGSAASASGSVVEEVEPSASVRV